MSRIIFVLFDRAEIWLALWQPGTLYNTTVGKKVEAKR